MKQQLPSGWPLVTLSVGGIPVALACEDPGLAGELTQRYRDFPIGGSPVFTAWVRVKSYKVTSAAPNPGVIFRDGVLHFADPDYDGFIDDEHGHGQLEISVSQPLEGIDYYLRMIFALLAFRAGGLMFHAAGIVRQGRAYLFFGHSGSGKTTVSRLSSGDLVLNDDLVLLLPQDGAWWVYATPFWNPTQVRPTRQCAPLVGLYRLVQSKQVSLREMGSAQALAELVSSVPVIPDDPGRAPELLLRGTSLLQAVPAYQLHFLPDASFWSVIVSSTAK